MKKKAIKADKYEWAGVRGKLHVLDHPELENIKRIGLDHETVRKAKAGETRMPNASPLKIRPIIVKDLTMFGTPK
jgi:hypothetical protein